MIEIFRDNLGVPHIECDTFEEGAKATAICHCEDDFFSIQLWLLAVHGKAGHFDDWDGVYLDFLYSFLNIEDAVIRLKSKISNEYLSAVQAYCQGVNEFATSHEEQILDKNIFPITTDKILEAQHLLEIIGIQLDKPYSYLKGTKKSIKEPFPAKEGSNIIAVSGKYSENGNSLMAIAPHQPLEGIYSFYEIHISYRKTQTELFGFILPITFTIFMGTNFKVAWGSTASYPDMYSIYEVSLTGFLNKNLHIDEGGIPISQHIYKNYFSFYGKIPLPFVKRYYRTLDGKPIVKIKKHYYLIDIPLIGYCLGTEINYKISTANSIDEILHILQASMYPYLDIVAIDTQDNLLFVHNTHEPTREEENEYHLDTISLKSSSQIPAQFEEHLFYIKNPASNYICSANQSPLHTDREKRKYTGKGLHYGNENSRSIRIKDLLESKINTKKINLEDLRIIFSDTKVCFPIIRGIDFSIIYKMNDKEPIQQLLTILHKWDGNANTESVGAAVFALLFYYYKDNYYIYHKNPDVIKIATEYEIRECLKWVNSQYRKGLTLGDIQSIQRGSKSYPIGGIPDSINTTRSFFEHGKLVAEEGCAFRMLIDLKSRDIRTCHPFGSSAHEKSEHYTSQLEMYINNKYKHLMPMEFYKQNYKTKRIIR